MIYTPPRDYLWRGFSGDGIPTLTEPCLTLRGLDRAD